jgi:thiamine-monophosphate kinase
MELEFLQWLRQHVPVHPRSQLGLSDDAAVVSLAGRTDVVVTTDMLTDGVDFQVSLDDPRRIGRLALGANLSDLAAMAAQPLAAVISLALPRRRSGAATALQLAIALYEGLLPLARQYDVAIVGGDTNTYDGPLVISVTALGQVTGRGAVTRRGARNGDWILVTGQLGGSILGHLFDFTPRVHEAMTLHERYELHSGIDISDGLAIDTSRLAEASGCGALIYSDRVPVSDDARRLAEREGAANPDAAALQHALGDGQDFELLISTAPPTAQRILHDQLLDCPITHVGEMIAESGLFQQDASGSRTSLQPLGWVHS